MDRCRVRQSRLARQWRDCHSSSISCQRPGEDMASAGVRLTGPRVVTLAYDGLCTFEFGVAVEVFALPRPEMGRDWYRHAVCGIEPGPLRAAGGLMVTVD